MGGFLIKFVVIDVILRLKDAIHTKSSFFLFFYHISTKRTVLIEAHVISSLKLVS